MNKVEQKIKVLFLCTGNACRSQIAEGWARNLKSDSIQALSAGVAPGSVNQMAIEIMAQAGVDISGHTSKHVDELSGIDFDYVITLCDNAKETCPVLPGKAIYIHNPFEDPSFMHGTPEEITAAFTKLREDIKEFIEQMPENLHRLNNR